MRKLKVSLETVTCRRCCKEIYLYSGEAHGNAKYGYLCSDCTSPEEKTLMQEQISLGIVRK